MVENPWSVSTARGVGLEATEWAGVLERFAGGVTQAAATVSAEQWERTSRCSNWTNHQVLRHMADAAEIHNGSFSGINPFDDLSEGFDPNTTPDLWMAKSESESPAESLERFQRFAASNIEQTTAELQAGSLRKSDGPYGETHWSTISWHVYWDAWLHLRDIAEPLSIEAPESGDEQKAAAMYGLLMCGVPAVRMGMSFDATVRLQSADGPLALSLAITTDNLSVTEVDSDTPTELEGDLLPVVDAMAGRGRPLADVLAGPKETVDGLGFLALVFQGQA